MIAVNLVSMIVSILGMGLIVTGVLKAHTKKAWLSEKYNRLVWFGVILYWAGVIGLLIDTIEKLTKTIGAK